MIIYRLQIYLQRFPDYFENQFDKDRTNPLRVRSILTVEGAASKYENNKLYILK